MGMEAHVFGSGTQEAEAGEQPWVCDPGQECLGSSSFETATSSVHSALPCAGAGLYRGHIPALAYCLFSMGTPLPA